MLSEPKSKLKHFDFTFPFCHELKNQNNRQLYVNVCVGIVHFNK